MRLEKMETNDSSFIKRYYKKYDINKLGKDDDKDLQRELGRQRIHGKLELIILQYDRILIPVIANGMYEIEQGDDYVKVKYSLGNVEKEYMIPPVCTVASMVRGSMVSLSLSFSSMIGSSFPS